MTRYELFNQLRELCAMQKTGEHAYNKMIQSGALAETHYDYNRGYYDVIIKYFYDKTDKKHYCRIWFGTIDDGDFGSWNDFETKEKAVALVEKAKDVFAEMVVCPNYEELNLMFRELGIYFTKE